ncbi:MAG: YibE/F family protein, partial [Spirochaetes bacterium]|nr:YibE/F family protein [Spirochaetota bacterium]
MPAVRPSTSNIILLAVLVLFSIGLLLIPTGYENELYANSVRIKVRVVSVDNSQVKQVGVTSHGHQSLVVESRNRRFSKAVWESDNLLMGKLELDTLYRPGDSALAVLSLHPDSGEVAYVSLVGPYRLDVQALLLGLFVLFLILYAGRTGLKAILSFVVSILVIWKLFVPGILRGLDPVLFAVALVAFLTAIVCFLVAGFTRKGWTAFLGSISGVVVTAILAQLFGQAFRLHGAIKPFSESLLHSGFGHLDLTALLYASIFIAASGAVMDLSMDIAAAVHEIHEKHPDISRAELVKSGMAVGRSVVGTMTTTLLFAYSSSYISLLMVFMAQNIPLANMLNLSYISADILTTLVGSFGLVT